MHSGEVRVNTRYHVHDHDNSGSLSGFFFERQTL